MEQLKEEIKYCKEKSKDNFWGYFAGKNKTSLYSEGVLRKKKIKAEKKTLKLKEETDLEMEKQQRIEEILSAPTLEIIEEFEKYYEQIKQYTKGSKDSCFESFVKMEVDKGNF